MSVAARAEDPGSIALIGVLLCIENACLRQIVIVNLSIFSVYVEDSISQHADRLDGIDTLPEHVAWIVVTADAIASDGAQLQHRFGTVDYEPGMHLDGDFDAVVFGELAMLNPVRRNFLLPLPLE